MTVKPTKPTTYYYLLTMDYYCPIRHRLSKESIYIFTPSTDDAYVKREVAERFGVNVKDLTINGRYSEQSFHTLKILSHEALSYASRNS
jgi:hypothetical protein